MASGTAWHVYCFTHGMNEALRIVVVVPDLAAEDDDEGLALLERSRQLRIGLLEAGYHLVASLPADVFLPDRLMQLQPDMVIVDAQSGARDTLEHVVVATRDAPRPVVLFTEENDTSHVKAAFAAGVSAYVVSGLATERIRPILEVARARFEYEQGLRVALLQAQNELQERRLLDRAKAMLMKHQGLSEPEAHQKLRKTAMDKGLPLAQVAQRFIDAFDLLA
jgi:two-component system, response regulator / RNA-binding antiterminator